jgi:hypothetical protein
MRTARVLFVQDIYTISARAKSRTIPQCRSQFLRARHALYTMSFLSSKQHKVSILGIFENETHPLVAGGFGNAQTRQQGPEDKSSVTHPAVCCAHKHVSHFLRFWTTTPCI